MRTARSRRHADHATQITHATQVKLRNSSSVAPSKYAQLITKELARHGITTTIVSELARTMRTMARVVVDRDPTPLPIALAEIAVEASETQGGLWWCRELFQLYDLIQVGKSPSGELALTNGEPNRTTLVKIARLYCEVNDLDAGKVSAQVAHAAKQGEPALDRLDSLALSDEPERPSTRSLAAVDDAQRVLLVAALNSSCQWLGQLASASARCRPSDRATAGDEP
jgi:hypothetical protein